MRHLQNDRAVRSQHKKDKEPFRNQQDHCVFKADKSQEAPEVDELLVELGNSATALPYYAMFRPGADPVHFNGVFWTARSFLEQLSKEGVVLDENRDPAPAVASKNS